MGLFHFQTFKEIILGIIKAAESDLDLELFHFLIKNCSGVILTANMVKRDCFPDSSLEVIAE